MSSRPGPNGPQRRPEPPARSSGKAAAHPQAGPRDTPPPADDADTGAASRGVRPTTGSGTDTGLDHGTRLADGTVPAVAPSPEGRTAKDAPSHLGNGKAVTTAATVLGWVLLSLSCYPMLFTKEGGDRFKFDAWIYHQALTHWWQGGDLYHWWAFPNDHLYPFTYPPFAAWLLSPLTLGDNRAAQVLLTLATPVCTALTVLLLARVLQLPERWLGVVTPWGALAACLLLEPFIKTIEYGQVNAILLLLVSVDLLALRPGGPLERLAPARGALCGLAAAIKLTPAIAVLVLLVRREWRAATVMSLTALAATGLGALLFPAETWEFFTQAMLDPTRAGDAEYAGNQNLRALLVRLVPAAIERPLWALSVVAAVLAACLLARRLERLRAQGCPEALVLLTQTCVVMTLGLLVSPISWSHHWVWGLPTLVALGALARRLRSQALLATAACGLTLLVMAMHWWLPEHEHVELYWPLWAKVTGSSYTLWALAGGTVLWAQLCRAPEIQRQETEEPGRTW